MNDKHKIDAIFLKVVKAMKEKLMDMLEARKEIRRYLHQYPELSFQEKEKAKYIEIFYRNKDVEIETNVGNGYGIIVTINGAKPGKVIGLRTDFDALSITEETNVPFNHHPKFNIDEDALLVAAKSVGQVVCE